MHAENKMTIRFNDLNFSCKTLSLKLENKHVLKNINGRFVGNELTAIVGPSGSGKTSLLNAITGYQLGGVSGTIQIDGDNIKKYRNQIAYVMQESHLYGLLTVHESMKFAAKMKIGSSLKVSKITAKISEILQFFGLEDHQDTSVKYLSGGQRKRLSIALEIINDPKLIFLDECTTGLDAASSYQCIKLLRHLVYKGHTIICTIHQPTTLMLKMFDHIYAMADGNCIYQGSLMKLLPFFKEIDFECPQTYNPVDFLMEIATDVYGDKNSDLINQIENGRNERYCESLNDTANIKSFDDFHDYSIPNSATQLFHLMRRNFLIASRNTKFTYFRLLAHLVCGILAGLEFGPIGNNAARVIQIYRLFFALSIMVVYTSMFSQIAEYPMNFRIIKNECFNKWYTPKAFNIALFVTDFPMIFLCVLLFFIPIYILSDQPFELFRFANCSIILLFVGFISQSIGLLAGCTRNVLHALTVAIGIAIYQGVFSGAFVLRKDTHAFIQPFFRTAYLNYATEGMQMALFGYNRTQLNCDEIYCHFAKPLKFLEFIDINVNFKDTIIMLAAYMVILRIIVGMIMNYQLKNK